jgi:hypothetical protein
MNMRHELINEKQAPQALLTPRALVCRMAPAYPFGRKTGGSRLGRGGPM